jgi:hypothetical protein
MLIAIALRPTEKTQPERLGNVHQNDQTVLNDLVLALKQLGSKEIPTELLGISQRKAYALHAIRIAVFSSKALCMKLRIGE